jgi:hypothetical protein
MYSVGQQLVRVYDAAKDKDVDTLKEVNRKSKGMIGRMAKLALAAIPLDQTYTAEHVIEYALEHLFYFSWDIVWAGLSTCTGSEKRLKKARVANEQEVIPPRAA